MMKMISLGEIAEYINGRPFKPEEWETNGLPIIRIQNLTGSSQVTNYYSGEYEKKHLVKKGDILISWSASLGVYMWGGNDAILNQHIFKVILKDRVDKLYFYYAASNALNEMISKVHGATMQHITKEPFEATLIPLPSLPEQKRIAAILEKADRLRRQHHYALELSNTYLQSVFLEMFKDTVSRFNIVTIEDIASQGKYALSSGPFGSNLTSAHYTQKGVMVLRGLNISEGHLNLDDVKYVNEEKAQELVRSEVHPGDIVVVGSRFIRFCMSNSSYTSQSNYVTEF